MDKNNDQIIKDNNIEEITEEKNREKNIVLFVDDEENILKSLKRGLMREKYKKLFASSGEDALRIMKRNDVSVIVTDMRMPHMSGLELLREVKELYPDTVKIVLSGYTQLPQVLATVNQVDIFKFITKPWDMETDFKRVIREAIDFYNIKFENEILRKSVSKKNELYQKLLRSNDEKLRTIKLDFHEIFELQKDVFIFMSGLCYQRVSNEIGDGDYNKVLIHITEMFSELTHFFPSEFSEMQIVDFIEEVNRVVFNLNHPDVKYNSKQHIKHVGFVGLENLLGTYRGNFKLLLYVLKKVFKNLLKCDSGNLYNIVLKKGEPYTEKGISRCKVTFLVDETRVSHEENRLVRKANVIILDHLMRSLGGGLQLSFKGDKLITVLELELEIKS